MGPLKLRLRRGHAGVLVAILALAAGFLVRHLNEGPHFLTGETEAFAASFDPPSAPDSPATRTELDALLAIQSARTPAQVQAARADRKTEVHRFYAVLGLAPEHSPELREVRRLAERVEDDVRIYVRSRHAHNAKPPNSSNAPRFVVRVRTNSKSATFSECDLQDSVFMRQSGVYHFAEQRKNRPDLLSVFSR